MPRLVEIIRRQQSGDLLSTCEMEVDSFEQLRAATPTSSSDIIQVEAGQMRGRLKHATLAGLSIGAGTFSRGLISRGVYSNRRVTIGLLFESRARRTDMGRLWNIRVWAPGTEHQSRYVGGASFGALSVSTEDLASFYGPESRCSDPSFWRENSTFSADPVGGRASAEALRCMMANFENRSRIVTPKHAEFWKRAILEAAMPAVADTQLETRASSPLKLVRKAQEFIDASGSTPVHLSELVNSLRISRSTLARAFDEVLGVSPIAYLRHRRLCEARIHLRERAGPVATIADVAFEQGFSDFGRFSRYYRALFGEYPSATLAQVRERKLTSGNSSKPKLS